MTWPTLRADLAAAVLEAFYSPAVYTPTVGDPIVTAASVVHGIADLPFGVPLPEYRTRVKLPRAGLPEPRPGDTVEVEGDVWIVAEHDPDGSGDQFVSLWVRPS